MEGGKTAAENHLTVANVLSLGMEVLFHACEVSPGTSIPWLANGVWRPDVHYHPKPIPYKKINKEKVAVFKKVAETCSILVSVSCSESSLQPTEVLSVDTAKINEVGD